MKTKSPKESVEKNISPPKRRQKIRRGLLIISVVCFPLTIFMFSPMLSIFGALKGVVNASVLVFGLLFVSSLFLGRAFCGWLGPCGALQDLGCQVNNTPLKRGRWIKFGLWIPWVTLLGTLLFKNNAFGNIDFFFPLQDGFFLQGSRSYAVYYMVITLFIVLPFSMGRRPICHYICWMAPFMIIGGIIRDTMKIPSLQIIADQTRCDEKCTLCTDNCPMSLDVENMVRSGQMGHTDCILCGECVDRCPRNSLQFIFSGKRNK